MTPLKSLITFLSVLTAVGMASVAMGEVTLLTVSVNTAAEQYYKVQDFMKEVQESQVQVQEKVAAIQEEGQALAEEFKELVEQAQSDILTEDARMEAQSDAQAKQAEVREKENELRALVQNAQQSMSAREQTQMRVFTKEITDVIDEIAAERNATIVFDISGASRNGLPTVLYRESSIDITEEVIARINADKPAEEEAAAE